LRPAGSPRFDPYLLRRLPGLAGVVQLRGQPQQPPPTRHFQLLHSRTDGGIIVQFERFQVEDSPDPRQFLQHVGKPPIRQIEVVFEAVNRQDHPICVAAVATLYRGARVSNDGFLSERYTLLREAGSLRLPNQASLFYILVN
jgi:hypothetical protein